jgi:hypothetical protein
VISAMRHAGRTPKLLCKNSRKCCCLPCYAGNSVCLFVHGFEPYFYCSCPEDWGPEHFQELKNTLAVRVVAAGLTALVLKPASCYAAVKGFCRQQAEKRHTSCALCTANPIDQAGEIVTEIC